MSGRRRCTTSIESFLGSSTRSVALLSLLFLFNPYLRSGGRALGAEPGGPLGLVDGVGTCTGHVYHCP